MEMGIPCFHFQLLEWVYLGSSASCACQEEEYRYRGLLWTKIDLLQLHQFSKLLSSFCSQSFFIIKFLQSSFCKSSFCNWVFAIDFFYNWVFAVDFASSSSITFYSHLAPIVHVYIGSCSYTWKAKWKNGSCRTHWTSIRVGRILGEAERCLVTVEHSLRAVLFLWMEC